jgi:hypothetical protein
MVIDEAQDTIQSRESAVCYYQNQSDRIQVTRISDVPGWYFERVVFPGQRLLFEAPIQANLEIHTGSMASAVQADCIPCRQLRVRERSTAA